MREGQTGRKRARSEGTLTRAFTERGLMLKEGGRDESGGAMSRKAVAILEERN